MLEEILQQFFNVKRPFYKNPPVSGVDSDGEVHHNPMTKAGWKAYNSLTDLIYALGRMDIGIDANKVIENLDQIVNEEY